MSLCDEQQYEWNRRGKLMAVVAGRVIFDRDRSATVNSVDSGIANIPVVLQNVDTNERLSLIHI